MSFLPLFGCFHKSKQSRVNLQGEINRFSCKFPASHEPCRWPARYAALQDEHSSFVRLFPACRMGRWRCMFSDDKEPCFWCKDWNGSAQSLRTVYATVYTARAKWCKNGDWSLCPNDLPKTKKARQPSDCQAFSFSRGDWIRTSDHTPPPDVYSKVEYTACAQHFSILPYKAVDFSVDSTVKS